uniref:Uncharacterized protein n=1 Tax=Favella ehrenbergii TaxID=182087 RepID=A0A7S3I5M3_9SPIT|mmetsp:Transcript_33778/g.41754  ORF Transcript_33778/g.41754 Transcript_33778/m.41754 type:complete len:112 (+) Transcript_33778:1328-1663(+)
MPKGPSLTESNGVATLEGKLRLMGGVNATGADQVSSIEVSTIQGEFESALTATVCLKIADYSFSGSRVESINFNQRLPQSQYGIWPACDPRDVTKKVRHLAFAKNIHFRFS